MEQGPMEDHIETGRAAEQARLDETEAAAGLLGKLDIDLGASRDLTGPVLRAFELRGVQMAASTLRALRSGRRNPARTVYRLACVDKLRRNDASLKNQLVLRVIREGLAYRRSRPETPWIYIPYGLTPPMEHALGCTHLDLSTIIRVMRADLAVWSCHTWDEEMVRYFKSAASTYLRVHRGGSRRTLRGRNDYINAAWDQHTIHGFYFALYSLGGSRARGAWLPYELDVLLRFYTLQQEVGNPLTPLDRLVLQGAVNREPRRALVCRMVHAQVGVTYRLNCHMMQRRILATGSFEPGATRRGARGEAEGQPRDVT